MTDDLADPKWDHRNIGIIFEAESVHHDIAIYEVTSNLKSDDEEDVVEWEGIVTAQTVGDEDLTLLPPFNCSLFVDSTQSQIEDICYTQLCSDQYKVSVIPLPLSKGGNILSYKPNELNYYHNCAPTTPLEYHYCNQKVIECESEKYIWILQKSRDRNVLSEFGLSVSNRLYTYKTVNLKMGCGDTSGLSCSDIDPVLENCQHYCQ
jgi:hypothetical protein